MKLAAPFLVALCACATSGRPRSGSVSNVEWWPRERVFLAKTAGFEAAVPAGWERAIRERDVLLVTRDGRSLQEIEVASSVVGEPLGLGIGVWPVSAGMTSAGLAGLFLQDARTSLPGLEVVERGTVELAGRDAVRVVVSYRDPTGLRRRVAFCGVMEGGNAYYAAYFAPERYYFALDLPVFEEVARSVRLR